MPLTYNVRDPSFVSSNKNISEGKEKRNEGAENQKQADSIVIDSRRHIKYTNSQKNPITDTNKA